MSQKISLMHRKLNYEIKKLKAEIDLLSAKTVWEKIRSWLTLVVLIASSFGGAWETALPSHPEGPPVSIVRVLRDDREEDIEIEKSEYEEVHNYISNVLKQGRKLFKQGQDHLTVINNMIKELEAFEQRQTLDNKKAIIKSAIQHLEKIISEKQSKLTERV